LLNSTEQSIIDNHKKKPVLQNVYPALLIIKWSKSFILQSTMVIPIVNEQCSISAKCWCGIFTFSLLKGIYV
jgi:hypothetical protein